MIMGIALAYALFSSSVRSVFTAKALYKVRNWAHLWHTFEPPYSIQLVLPQKIAYFVHYDKMYFLPFPYHCRGLQACVLGLFATTFK